MELALASFAREHVDGNTVIVLLWDQAGFHQTGNMSVPSGIEFFPLPPYTPELQPAERLWPCLHEPMANRWIRTLDHLEGILCERIISLMKVPSYIQALTGFEWILSAQNTTS
jgi:transposase